MPPRRTRSAPTEYPTQAATSKSPLQPSSPPTRFGRTNPTPAISQREPMTWSFGTAFLGPLAQDLMRRLPRRRRRLRGACDRFGRTNPTSAISHREPMTWLFGAPFSCGLPTSIQSFPKVPSQLWQNEPFSKGDSDLATRGSMETVLVIGGAQAPSAATPARRSPQRASCRSHSTTCREATPGSCARARSWKATFSMPGRSMPP